MARGSKKTGLGKALKTAVVLFAGASVAVAAAGQAVAWKRDKESKPSLDNIIDVTSGQAQEVLDEATRGTGIVLNPNQKQPIPGVDDTYRYHVVKRGFDVVFSACASVACAIPTLFVCGLIWLDEPGKPIYKQRRVGRYGAPIDIYKLRTMVVGADQVEKHLTPEQIKQWETEHKVDDDPRVTKIGKFLRKTSLDEIPQFWNVLKGDMSLVGPRPERPFFVEKFREEIPRYMVKHQVRPGLTGWAQVNGYRGDTSIRKRIECDLYYIENWTVSFDIKILFLTFFKGFINKNAY